MRLGGPVFATWHSPQGWAEAVRALGYQAAFCPLEATADARKVEAFRAAAAAADIVIAEVGAWSNPLSLDPAERAAALDKCKRHLDLAERIGARCCVNIAGSCGAKWDGPHADDLTPATFARIVATVQQIIDAVGPQQTRYTLETMPWMYPDSADAYLELLRAIDRPAMAVHLDPVNLVCSPQRYFATGALLRECFAKLGPHIRSCHAKDIKLDDNLTVHLREVRPGTGGLDYRAFLDELDKLPADTPLMLEHLSSADEYVAAAEHVRRIDRQRRK
jgi:sugar phosphate isomerase/epimerase